MLNVALSSAVSSLLTIEKQIAVGSNNIANASTVGYTRETVQVAERVSGGVGTGVTDLGTVSNVDKYLQAAVVQSNSQSVQATTFNSIYQSLQEAFGQISTGATGGNDLASQLSSLQSSLAQLADSPENAALRTQVVGQMDTFVSNLRSLSSQIQQLRTNADSQICQVVGDANTQLNAINALNKQIKQAAVTGQPTASLSDQRGTALQALTADLGVSYYTDASGAIQIYTPGGQPLLLGDVVNPLSHTAVSIGSNSIYPGGGIGGIMVGTTDITAQVGSGKMQALIKQRDTELPNAQQSLDNLAQTLSGALNALSNRATANPPPATLTGTSATPFTPGAAVVPSVAPPLTVRIALVAPSGQIQAYQDVNLSGQATVANVMTQINTAFGTALVSVNAQGQLVLAAPPAGATVSTLNSLGVSTPTTLGGSTGIAVTTLGGDLGGTDFSSYFHLNDVLTSGSSPGLISATNIAVNPAMLTNSSLLPTATLTSAAGTVPFTGVSSGDASIASAMSNALLNPQAFGAAGYLGATSTSFAGYAADITADVANRASYAKADDTSKQATLTALQQNLSAQSGVNVDEEMANLTSLQSAYASSAKVISTVNAMFQSLLQAVGA